LVIGCCVIAPASAQESRKEWRISSPGGQSTVYSTQQEAVAAIKGLPAPPGVPPEARDGWNAVDKIKSQRITFDGKTDITYWMGKAQPSDPEWGYMVSYGTQKYASEDQMVTAYNATWQPNPFCAGETVAPSGAWTPAFPGFEGFENRTYERVVAEGDNSIDYPCEYFTIEYTFTRTRRLDCPARYTQWSNKEEACVNEDFLATITSTSDVCEGNGGAGSCFASSPAQKIDGACDGNVGNPCNVKTGEKYEIAPDFDLGWIALTRFYHSGVSTTLGGFGHGWTHSLGIRLVTDGAESAGLIEGTGYQRPFKKVGTAFEATDGSGDRLVQNGNWTLYTGHQTTTFDAAGRVLAIRSLDGTSLTYLYDDRDRLVAVGHSSGRVLEFTYASDAYEAHIASVQVEGVPMATYAYTAAGQVANVTYADGSIRTYHYEDARFPHHLTGITAEDGRRYSIFTYDALGRVISSQHAGGADGVTLDYSSSGGALVTDALGHQTNYALTPGGQTAPPRKVTALADTRGVVARTYNAVAADFRQRLATLTDRDDVQTSHAYADITDVVTGQPASRHTVTEAVGLPEQRITQTVRDQATNVLLASTVGNRETRYAYNTRLQPVSMVIKDLAAGDTRTTTFTYCEAADAALAGGACPIEGLPKAVDGPRLDAADVTTYTYFAMDDAACAASPATCAYRKGDLRSITNALGHSVETLAYDSAGRPASVKDTNGVVTDYTYHPRGWLATATVRGATAADDRSTQMSYWPTGLVQQVTAPDGSSVSYVYDAAQRLTDIADDAGNTIHYTLDNAGNRLKEHTVDAGGTLRRTLARVYNTLGQLITLKDAGNHATGFVYDVNGNAQSITDALQRVTAREHDPLNRLARTLQDVGGIEAEIRTRYNALDQVTQVTDPKGLHTTYAYNGFGDQTTLVSPDTGTTVFTLDAAGNRTTRTDARGVTATYHYDALNRITGIAYPDPNLDVGYSYDIAPSVCAADERFAKGRIGTVLHAGGSTAYCHGRFGQVTRKVQTVNGVTTTLRYSYTKAGRLASLTYPDGSVADYVRDSQGRISQIGLTRSGLEREVVISQVTHAAFGPPTGWTYGNGRQLQRPLDLDYRPQAVHDPASGGLSLSYGYDPAGSIIELKNGAGTSILAKYAYDPLGRLTQTQDGPTGTPIETYAYDATGNRIGLTTAAGTSIYTYPANSHHLAAVDGQARSYDAAGNTVSVADKDFAYSDANRMSAVKQVDEVVESYSYNHRSERVLRAPASGDAQLTMYDEAGQWIGNYSAAGLPQQQAIWLDEYPIALIGAPSAGVPEVAYIQPDHLGTPRVVIDAMRDVAIWEWSNKGEAFGYQAPASDPDGDGVAFDLALRFPGQQATDASEMFYNYQREYDSSVGRYSQSDPIGLKGGVSTFAYVESSPLRSIDSTGLSATSEDGKRSFCVNAHIAAGSICGGATGYYAGGAAGGVSGAAICTPTGPGLAACSAGGAIGGSAAGGALGSIAGGYFGGLIGQARCSGGGDDDDSSDCRKEIQHCISICNRAKSDPDMKNVWGGSFAQCLLGCVSWRCMSKVGPEDMNGR
jgi:RHS repeat-associated protein